MENPIIEQQSVMIGELVDAVLCLQNQTKETIKQLKAMDKHNDKIIGKIIRRAEECVTQSGMNP